MKARVVALVALAAAVAWAAVNVTALVSLSQQSGMHGDRIRTEGLRASAARASASGNSLINRSLSLPSSL